MRKYARNPGLNYVCTLGEQSTQRFSLYQCIRTHLPVQLCVGANLFARFEANLFAFGLELRNSRGEFTQHNVLQTANKIEYNIA